MSGTPKLIKLSLNMTQADKVKHSLNDRTILKLSECFSTLYIAFGNDVFLPRPLRYLSLPCLDESRWWSCSWTEELTSLWWQLMARTFWKVPSEQVTRTCAWKLLSTQGMPSFTVNRPWSRIGQLLWSLARHKNKIHHWNEQTKIREWTNCQTHTPKYREAPSIWKLRLL